MHHGILMYEDKRKVANDTLNIIRAGRYRLTLDSHNRIYINKEIDFCVNHTRVYNSNEEIQLHPSTRKSKCKYEVTIESTLEAAKRLQEESRISEVAVLNFASPTKPGGGWLNGRDAQEESITRQSALYMSINTREAQKKFYEFHADLLKNDGIEKHFYTDTIIYSPKVPVIRDAMNENLIQKFFLVSFITSAATNLKAILEEEQSEAPKMHSESRKSKEKLPNLYSNNRQHNSGLNNNKNSNSNENQLYRSSNRKFIASSHDKKYNSNNNQLTSSSNDNRYPNSNSNQINNSSNNSKISNSNNQLNGSSNDNKYSNANNNQFNNSSNSSKNQNSNNQLAGSSNDNQINKSSNNSKNSNSNNQLNGSSNDNRNSNASNNQFNNSSNNSKNSNSNNQFAGSSNDNQINKSSNNNQINKSSNNNQINKSSNNNQFNKSSNNNQFNNSSNNNQFNNSSSNSKISNSNNQLNGSSNDNINSNANDLKNSNTDKFHPKLPEPTQSSSGQNPRYIRKAADDVMPESSNSQPNPPQKDGKFQPKPPDSKSFAKVTQVKPPDEPRSQNPRISSINDSKIKQENYAIMRKRCEKIIKVAINNGNKALVLGAFGCGIFGNDPAEISQIFYDILVKDSLGDYLDTVVFAIKGASVTGYTFTSFEKRFANL